jgi:hypothetical protein
MTATEKTISLGNGFGNGFSRICPMVYGVGGEHLFLIWRKGVKTLIYNIQVI